MIKSVRFLLAFTICFISFTYHAQARTHTIVEGDTPWAVAKRHGISVDELLSFNSISPGGSFRVGTVLQIPKKGAAVPRGEYTVSAGDSIARVADFFGVAQDDLRAENNMSSGASLQVGQTIRIPRNLRGGMRGHVVRKGDTLGAIAKKYDSTVKDIAVENKIGVSTPLQLGRTLLIPHPADKEVFVPKKAPTSVVSGVKVKGGVMHTVQSGQNIWIISRAYNVSQDRIAKANNMSLKDPLQAGLKLIIPGARNPVPVQVSGSRVAPIRFVRVHNNKGITIRLVRNNGTINPAARRQLSQLSAPLGRNRKGNVPLFHPRLIRMLQRAAERFPGRTFEIVSGYRPGQTGNESRHSQGRAIDFRIVGVSNRELYEFCTQLPSSGCGYYPNSTFIHMDARDEPARWTDYSSPGEKAKYSSE